MRQFSIFSTAVAFIVCLSSCNSKADLTNEKNGIDITMPTSIVNFEGSGVNFFFSPVATRSSSNGTFKMVVSDEATGTSISSFLTISPTSDGGVSLDHFADDCGTIATLIYDKFGKCVDIVVYDASPQTRGFSSWWNCTQYHYKTYRKHLQEKDSMLYDLASDWLPMATLEAARAGLYCM